MTIEKHSRMKRIFEYSKLSARVFSVLVICVFADGLFAEARTSYHSHDSLLLEVEEFIRREHKDAVEIQLSIQPIDSRIVLSPCSESDLSLFWPPGSNKIGQTSVAIACSSRTPWKLFVRSKIVVFGDILVLSEPVLSGESLKTSNIAFKRVNMKSQRSDVLTNVDSLMGYTFKRRYPADRALSLSMLSPPLLVRRGEDVLILSEAGGLRVRVKGIAMSNGELNQSIKVKNTRSNRIVQGRVNGVGIVKVSN